MVNPKGLNNKLFTKSVRCRLLLNEAIFATILPLDALSAPEYRFRGHLLLENTLRYLSCILVVLIGLTALLSGHDPVQANVNASGAGHHAEMVNLSVDQAGGGHASHVDICGVTLCGPFADIVNGSSVFMPLVSSAQFWIKDQRLFSADQDGSYKPPRA